MLAVVKLKEAKNYLKELFYHTSSNPVYQESDIMMGIRYLLLLSNELQAPLVICIGLGSNQGAHSGQSACIVPDCICQLLGSLFRSRSRK